jgi:DNA-binding beta-propeller fold protein YncE
MTLRTQKARNRAIRPTLDGLESRALLSAATVSPRAAEISALRVTHVSTINQIAATTGRTASTIPANGDVNPYGVAFVPAGFPRNGVLQPGDVLVANFNNSANLQGTGTTIVRTTPGGQTSVFFTGAPGLDTALAVLKSGFVLVGTVPSTDGTSATAGQGSVLVLDRNGNLVATLADPNLLNGPWDMTVHDAGNRGQVFVANVLSGTVSRFDFAVGRGGNMRITSAVQIASGYTHSGDPAAFELGPTGLAFDSATNTLYVASTADNTVFAISRAASRFSDAGTGRVVYQDPVHLHGPLGMTFAPDGNLIVANGDAINSDPNQPSELVEFTRTGRFIGQFSLSTSQGGAFGVAAVPGRRGAMFAAVNDVDNTLTIWPIRV